MNLKNRPTQAKSVMQALTGLKKTESKKGVNLLKLAKNLAKRNIDNLKKAKVEQEQAETKDE